MVKPRFSAVLARGIVVAACVLAGASACTDAGNPVTPSDRSAFSVALRPQFKVYGGEHMEDLPINFVRLVARDSATDVIYGSFEGPLVSTAATWDLNIALNIPDDATPTVVITIELINVTRGEETVEWSGETAPIPVKPGSVTQPTATIDVYPGPATNLGVTQIAITEPDTSVQEDQDIQLHATAQTTVPVAPQILWSTLTPTIALVGDSGLVHPVRNGVARIVALAGAHSDTITITSRQRTTSLVLTADTVHASSLGEDVVFTARATDVRGNPVADAAIVWRSLDPSSVQSSGEGQFHVLANGTVAIEALVATDTTVRVRGAVVTTQVPASVSTNVQSLNMASLGDSASVTASVKDANGATISGAGVSWSTTNAGVAMVSSAGRVVSAGNGTADVIATLGALSAHVHVTVSQQATTLGVSTTTLSFATLTRTAQLSATARDGRGNVVAATLQWTSSDATVASVSASGLVTALHNGTTQISAHAGTLNSSSAVTVQQQAATMTISPGTAALATGDSIALSAVARDSSGAPVTDAITWSSSNPSIVTVTAAGLAKAVATGSATISARSGVASASAGLDVVAPNIVFTSVIAGSPTVLEGDTVPLAIALQNSGNADAPAGRIRVRIVNAGNSATVTESDIPEPALAAGATLTVTVPIVITRDAAWPDHIAFEATADADGVIRESLESDNVLRSASVTVTFRTNVLVLQPDSITFRSISAHALAFATLRDAQGRVVVRPIVWTTFASPPGVVNVAQDGTVTALATGTTHVVATSDGRADTITVTVKPAAAHISVGGAHSLNFIGASLSLTAVATDSAGTVVQSTRTWRSLDPTILGVDSAGHVVANGNGNGRIELRVDGVADTIAIAVQQIAASMTVTPSSKTLSVGDTVRLTKSVKDSAGVVIIAANVTWSVDSARVATVNSSGLVQTLAAGNATITAQNGLLHASASVSVTAPDLRANLIQLNGTNFVAGGAITGSVSVSNIGGAAAAADSVSLRVLDAATDTLLRDTVVAGIPLGAGQTVGVPILAVLPRSIRWPDSIRFEVHLNAGHSIPDTNTANDVVRSSAVRVVFPVKSIVLSTHTLVFGALGRTQTVHASLTDDFGRPLTDRTITYVSHNPGVASVNAGGVITSVANGDAWVFGSAEASFDSVLVHVAQVPLTLHFAEHSSDLLVGDTTHLTVQAADSNGVAIAFPAVAWTSSRPTIASINGSGLILGVSPDTVTISATVGALTTTMHLSIVSGAPASIVVDGPSSFNGTVGQLLANNASVLVRDSRGHAVPNAAVEWLVLGGTQIDGGSGPGADDRTLPPATDTTYTNGDGRATFAWQLGTHAGQQKLRARPIVIADSVVFAANAHAGNPARAQKNSGGLTATVSQSLSDAVEIQVFDEYGNPVPNVVVDWSIDEGEHGHSKLPNDSSVYHTTTDSEGRATLTWSGFDTKASLHHLVATVDGTTIKLDIQKQTKAGPPKKLQKDSGGDSVSVSLTLKDTVDIQVFDEFDNPVDSALVHWSVVGGPSRLPNNDTSYDSRTDSLGHAFIDWSGFTTTVSLHRLRVTVDGVAEPLTIEKQTKPGKLKRLHLSPDSIVMTSLEQDGEFTTAPSDEFGNAIIVPADSIVWLSADQVDAEVVNAHSGKVKSHGNGKTVIRVVGKFDGVEVTDSVVVDVAQQAVGVTIPITIEGVLNLLLNGTAVFTAAGVDANAKPIKNWRWTITNGTGHAEIVESTANSVSVHGLATGTVTLKASDPSGHNSQTITLFIIAG